MLSIPQILSYLSLWSFTGCFLFSIYVVFAFRSGLVYTARKQDGTLKERVPLTGMLASGSLLVAIILLLVLSNKFGLGLLQAGRLDFLPLFLLNYGHYIILFLFDTLVIDGLVLAVWRPSFLNLPDELGRESMGRHMLLSILVGLVAGALLSAASSAISYFWVLT